MRGHGLVHVLSVVGFAYRDEQRSLVKPPTRAEALPAGKIGDEGRIAHRIDLGQPGYQFVGVGELRNPLGRYERAHFDTTQPRIDHALNQLQLDVDAQNFAFVLQAVARTDFAQLQLGHDTSLLSALAPVPDQL